MPVVIAGAGDFGREMAGWMRMIRGQYRGFIDDEVAGVLSTIREFEPELRDELLVCIATPKGREAVVRSLVERIPTVKFHGFSYATISPNAKRGTGCIFCPHSLMSNGSEVGDFVIVNVFSSVGHNVKVGSFTTLSSYVDLCGNVTVGERVFFGSGARVLPGVTIWR